MKLEQKSAMWTSSQRVTSEPVAISPWMDRVLAAFSLSLLSLSVFSAPMVTRSQMAILIVIGAGVLYISSTNGRTAERITQRRVALFLVLLLNVYLIRLADGWAGKVLYGYTPTEVGGLIGLAVFVLWCVRTIRLNEFKIVRSMVDAAVLFLFFLTTTGFLGLAVMLHLNGLSPQVKSDPLWVVLCAALLYFIFADLFESELAIRRTLRLSLFPMAAVCLLAPLAFWLTK